VPSRVRDGLALKMAYGVSISRSMASMSPWKNSIFFGNIQDVAIVNPLIYAKLWYLKRLRRLCP
jgi:hypothetical protein